jgi:NADP-dependent 3-hydroxy acid dehydrogenase YdfG
MPIPPWLLQQLIDLQDYIARRRAAQLDVTDYAAALAALEQHLEETYASLDHLPPRAGGHPGPP